MHGAEDDAQDRGEEGEDEECKKGRVVSSADACVQERAVVVDALYADVADSTVAASRGTIDVTSFAPLERQVLAIAYADDARQRRVERILGISVRRRRTVGGRVRVEIPRDCTRVLISSDEHVDDGCEPDVANDDGHSRAEVVPEVACLETHPDAAKSKKERE